MTVVPPRVVTPAASATSAPAPPIIALTKSSWAPVLRMNQLEELTLPLETLPKLRPRTLPVARLRRMSPVAPRIWRVLPDTSIVR